LSAESKLMSLVRLLGKPIEVPQTATGWLKEQLPQEETAFLRQARIELIVPIASAADRTEALLALGVKRSEEPYTREDLDLLVAIASSLALLLECPQCGVCYDSGVTRKNRLRPGHREVMRLRGWRPSAGDKRAPGARPWPMGPDPYQL
jgi:hypothetical protein